MTDTETDRQIRRRTGWQALGVAVLLFGVVAGSVLLPRRTVDASGWTHQELLAHLHKRGVRFQVLTQQSEPVPARMLTRPGVSNPPIDYARRGTGCIVVTREASVEWAKVLADVQQEHDAASRTAATSFAWGAFRFDGDPDFVAEIRAALR